MSGSTATATRKCSKCPNVGTYKNRSICYQCYRAQIRGCVKKKPEHYTGYRKAYNEKHSEEQRAYHREYRARNRGKRQEQAREYYRLNKQRIDDRSFLYYWKNRAEILERQRRTRLVTGEVFSPEFRLTPLIDEWGSENITHDAESNEVLEILVGLDEHRSSVMLAFLRNGVDIEKASEEMQMSQDDIQSILKEIRKMSE